MTKKKGTIEEQEQRSKFTALRYFLRRCWVKWPERSACIQSAKRPYVGDNKRQKWEYQCNICKNWYKWVKKEMVVDHIIPAGTFLCDADYKTFIPGLFCDRSNLQVLCSNCHKIKTAQERSST